MRTQQAAPSPGKANLALATLFSGIFVLGSAELLVVGVLNLIAADLRVSIPAAGALVTAYAPGLAIGGPILTALTIKLNKRTILIGTLILFVADNIGPGLCELPSTRLLRTPVNNPQEVMNNTWLLHTGDTLSRRPLRGRISSLRLSHHRGIASITLS